MWLEYYMLWWCTNQMWSKLCVIGMFCWWCFQVTEIAFQSVKQIWAVTWQKQQSDCVPSEDSDQPTQISLGIRQGGCSGWSESSLGTQSDQPSQISLGIRQGGCPGWSESSLGTQSLCWFVMSQLNSNSYLYSYLCCISLLNVISALRRWLHLK